MELKHNNQIVQVSVKRSKRKTIGIKIGANGEVQLSAPLGIAQKTLEKLVNEKKEWIFSKLSEVKSKQAQVGEHTYMDGDRFLYMGQEFVLEVQVVPFVKGSVVNIKDNTLKIIVKSADSELIKKTLEVWYRNQAQSILRTRVDFYKTQLEVHPVDIRVKDQKRRWGSCSSNQRLNFNWRIVMAPIEVIDYLVVHELCHLKEMNHSKAFWAHVEQILPDFKRHQKWLKDHSLILMNA